MIIMRANWTCDARRTKSSGLLCLDRFRQAPGHELIEPVAGVLSDPGERISESLQISMTDVEGRIRVMG